MISIHDLKERLDYDPETGLFRWRSVGDNHNKTRIGMLAGTPAKDGYLTIGLFGKQYRAHRLAWFYVNGSFPKGQLDHIDRNPQDNRISNLREVTQSQQMMNRRGKSKSQTGVKGVRFYKNAYEAYITANERDFYLGRFQSIDEAIKVRRAAEEALHGEYSCAS